MPANVGYCGQSGQHLLNLSFTAFDPKRTSCSSNDSIDWVVLVATGVQSITM
jgi:hypothetical protein